MKALNPAAMNVSAGKCRSCGAAIIWRRTAAGKPMPIDAEPCERGNLLLEGEGVRTLSAAELAALSDADERPRYISHYATCPRADHWREIARKRGLPCK